MSRLISLIFLVLLFVSNWLKVAFCGNLVYNGYFEKGENMPDGWKNGTKGDIHKLVKEGENIVWEYLSEKKTKCIKFVITKPIAETTGIGYVSDPIKVEKGKKYNFSVDVLTEDTKVIVFIDGYKIHPTGREILIERVQINCEPEEKGEVLERKRKGRWQTFKKTFTLIRNIKYIKINLYAYYPPGNVYFDNVELKLLRNSTVSP